MARSVRSHSFPCGLAIPVLLILASSAAAQALVTSIKLPLVMFDTNWDDTRLAGLGDINNDGHADILVGARMGVDYWTGMVQVRSGADGSVLAEWIGQQDGRLKGLDSAGDVDGDGLEDVIFGEPGDPILDPLGTGYFVVYSSATHLLIGGYYGAQGDHVGGSVAGLGDLTGDGISDYAVGAPDEHSGPGFVNVFSGASMGMLIKQLGGTIPGQEFGRELASAGDMNADGTPDMAVVLRVNGSTYGVRVYSGEWLVHGTEPAILVDLPAVASITSVDGAGDVNGDGFDDLLVGTPDGGTPPGAGGFFVLSGKDHVHLIDFANDTPGQRVGWSVAGAGDLDGDGTPDLLAAGSNWDGLIQDPGRAVAVSGKDGSLLGSVVGQKGGWSYYFGYGLADVRDVNADGARDWALSGTDDLSIRIYTQVGLWTDVGSGLAGSYGIPQLGGTGELLGGTPVVLQLDGALPIAPVWLVLGTFAVNRPFKAGVFVPDAGVIFPSLVTDGLGSVTVSGTLPPDMPPSEFWFQAWQPDPAGPLGYAASNALRAQVP